MGKLILAFILIVYFAFDGKSINLFVDSRAHNQQHHHKHLHHHHRHHHEKDHGNHHHRHHNHHHQQQQDIQDISELNSQHIRHSGRHNGGVLDSAISPENSKPIKVIPNLWTLLDRKPQTDKSSYSETEEMMNDEPLDSNSKNSQSGEIIYPSEVSDYYITKSGENINNNNNDDDDNIRNEIHDKLNKEKHNKNHHYSSPSSSSSSSDEDKGKSIKCPKCSGSTNNVRVSEEELTELRIEFVKNQILQKLRLKERPKISARDLPKPIYEGATMNNDEKSMSRDLDDYYARTRQKFIFLEREEKECYRHSPVPAICFSFKIDDEVDDIDVNTAELWVYKKKSEQDRMKQTIIVSEMERSLKTKYIPKIKPIAIQSSDAEEGWIKFDIAWPIRKWFGNHDLSHLIQISCQSCEMETNGELLTTDKDYRPFIVIDTQSRRQRHRQKRDINCTAGETECCREKLYISFAEIGWDDWIIAPPGYNAYFCRGSCSALASLTSSSTYHSTFVRKAAYQRTNDGKKPLELIPCCTPKKYSSLQLFYRDSNNTAILQTLPNMVVESCGCM